MPKRLARLAVLAAAILLIALPAVASAAPSPWWQIVNGSRPSNLWIAGDNVQEIKVELADPFESGEGSAAARIDVAGTPVGCLGAGPFASFLCPGFGFSEVTETAPQLEALLQSAFANPAVEVSGGPVGAAPFIVRVPKHSAPPVAFVQDPELKIGTFSNKVLSAGGSGRLVATLTNLGDAPLDATSKPLTITDKLPEGAEATKVEANAGIQNLSGPVDCEVKAADEVSCSFEGTLPSYESIEVETYVNLEGEPPAPGTPGKVSVSGANAHSASAPQPIKVSPDPVPFGIEYFSSQAEEEGGEEAIQAGSHPFQVTNTIQLNAGPISGSAGASAHDSGEDRRVSQPGLPRNLRFPLPRGLVGNAAALPQCALNLFFAIKAVNQCPDESAIGVTTVTFLEPQVIGFRRETIPVFNLPPAQGEPARFGFVVGGLLPVLVDFEVDPENSYRLIASVRNTTQLADLLSDTLTVWGTPGDTRHDSSRGWSCVYRGVIDTPCERPSSLPEGSFLRMPVSCDGPLDFDASVEPWNTPIGSQVFESSFEGEAQHGCNRVPFDPTIASTATSKLAANPSGLDFKLEMPNANLNNPGGIAEAQPKKVEVTLPEGVTVNPSSGEGLVGCSEEEFHRESANSQSGAGCPDASRIGDVKVSTPLLKEEASGALYVAQPHANPFDSLLGLYLVARIPERGIIIRLAGKVEPDPQTGQLTTTFDNLPQLPFTTFKLHFREGGRAPLVTPPACGSYETEARFVPWSAANTDNPAPNEITERKASFTIERGVDGGACPPKSTPPFHPGLLAGTVTNAAGRFSPFNVRLTRNDGEQEFTHFSIKLPPGITGKLAGVPYCSEAAIAQARARTGIHGGQEELDHPSCPAASQVGRTLVGAGVGSILTYVPGKLYLAGPYHGAPLSMVAITSGVVGPFDIGTVVVRQAFRIDPETAEVFVDATGSDAIPHIIQGIPVHARDIRAYVDRPEFTLNPTNCSKTSTASTVLGSGLDFASEADDNPITVSSPFQAADCAALDFSPKLTLQLKGGTKRGAHPAFKATLKMHGFGDAAIKRAQVTLPRSEFIENAHFKTICTRVQFKAGAGNGANCPAGSVYGHAKAITPILDGALEGPVFLRSSEHQLPDLVAALHAPNGIDFDLVGRVDSVKGGGLRNTFEAAPDAPVTSFVLTMQGGKKGLFVNSTNLCVGKHEADVSFDAHNGKIRDFRSPLKAQCGKSGKTKKHRQR